MRQAINDSHRYKSFADIRHGNFVKWCVCSALGQARLFLDLYRHIDGHDYMYALSEILDSARECIFILVRPHTLPPSPCSLVV